MATGATTVTINTLGQIQIQSVLPTGFWSSPAVSLSPTITILVDDGNGGGFERSMNAITATAVSGPTTSTTSTLNDTVTIVYETSGDDFGNIAHAGVHTDETVELVTELPAGFITDTQDESGAVSAGTSLTNNSTIDKPKPIAMWAFAPNDIYTGSVEVLVDAFSRYGIASVEIELTSGSQTISKTVTSRTTVDIGSDNFITNKIDLYQVVFSSAEIADGLLSDGPATLTFIVTGNDGSETRSEGGGTGFKVPQPWPVYLDQSGTFTSERPVAYIDQSETVTTGALSGGAQFTKGNRIEANGSVGNTVIGIVAEDYSGSGTLTFWRFNPQIDTIGHIANAATITEYLPNTDTATGVTAVASSESTYTVDHSSTPGTLGNVNDPFSSIGWAARAVSLENESNGYGRQPAGRYICKTPITLAGNDDFMFVSGVVNAISWMDIEMLDGTTNEDVFLMGDGGQTSRYLDDSNYWYHFKGTWAFRPPESGSQDIISIGSTDDGHVWCDDIVTYAPGRVDAQMGAHFNNFHSVFIYGYSSGIADVDVTTSFTQDTSREQNLGLVLRNFARENSTSNSADSGDTFQCSNVYNAFIGNCMVTRMQGSAAGNHYDTFQTAAVSGNIIVHNFIDLSNRYQHTFFGQGIDSTGWAHINVIAEKTDDGDIGSSCLSFGNDNPEPLDHFVAAHCTFLDESSTVAIGNAGDLSRNTVIQHCYATGLSSTLASQANRHPNMLSSVQNCYLRKSDGTGAYGVRGTGGSDTALGTIFVSPGDGTYPSSADDFSDYRPTQAGPLTQKLTSNDNIHGLITDVSGRAINFNGNGAVGALQHIISLGTGGSTLGGRRRLNTRSAPTHISSPNFEVRGQNFNRRIIDPNIEAMITIPSLSAPVTVELQGTEADYEVRYTTNNRNPTSKSLLYTGPFQVSRNLTGSDKTVIKARIFHKNNPNIKSRITKITFSIGG